MAINNPYVPGDPFSYDLKWLVRKIREHQIILDGLDERIQNAIIAALENLDQLSPKYFESAADLIGSDLKDKSIAYIEGFYARGDGGANLYYVTTDYNDIIGVNFYLTLDGPNRWALPIIVTPYVMPEMFGAYGDGTNDDSNAFEHAFKYDDVVLSKEYLITEDLLLHSGLSVKALEHSIIDVRHPSTGHKVFYGNGIENFSWTGGNFIGTGVASGATSCLFSFDDSTGISITNTSMENLQFIWAIRMNNTKNARIEKNNVDHYSYGAFGSINGCKNIVFNENIIKNLDIPGSGNGYPIMMSGGEEVVFNICENIFATNNYIENTLVRWEGIDAHGGVNLFVTGNTIVGCLNGIAVFNEEAGVYNYKCENVTIANNICVGPDVSSSVGHGIIAGGKSFTIADNIIRNFDAQPLDGGIYGRYLSDAIISDNVIEMCGCAIIFSDNDTYSDGPTLIRGNIFNTCGRRSDTADSAAIKFTYVQKRTIIEKNIFEKSDGVLRAPSLVTASGYIKFTENVIAEPIDDTRSGINELISDTRTLAPTASNTKMGCLGDTCKLWQPTTGQPIGWICTSAWDGSSVTWTALPNL